MVRLKECRLTSLFDMWRRKSLFDKQPFDQFSSTSCLSTSRSGLKVVIDLFQYQGKSYLLVCDALFNFQEVVELNDTSSAVVIDKLGAIFVSYGIPLEVCTDNGPQFSSQELGLFAKKYNFRQYPQSNGLAEKGVQVVKRILKKTKEAHEDFWLGLLGYRSTRLEDGRSPGELLQERRLRSTFPDFSSQP